MALYQDHRGGEVSLPPGAEPVPFSATTRMSGLDLADGRSIVVPLAWYPRLLHATDGERVNWRLLGDGYAVEWPDLDEHIGDIHRGSESGHSRYKSVPRRTLVQPTAVRSRGRADTGQGHLAGRARRR